MPSFGAISELPVSSLPVASSPGAYTLNADSGSYAISGTAATLLKNSVVDAVSGAYVIAGTDATLLRNKVLPGDSGAYLIAGTDATIVYTLTGAYTLNADSGAYSITGADVTFVYTPNADQQATGGGEYLRHKLIRQFEDDQRRVEALSKLPAIKPAERLAVKRAAHKLATSVEPFTFDDVAAEITASLRETDTKGQESHLDWILYFLRVEAYNLEKQAREAEELEIIAAMMMARKQWQL